MNKFEISTNPLNTFEPITVQVGAENLCDLRISMFYNASNLALSEMAPLLNNPNNCVVRQANLFLKRSAKENRGNVTLDISTYAFPIKS